MLMNAKDLVREVQEQPWAKGLSLGEDDWIRVMEWIERNVLSAFLGQVSQQVDEIVEIDPDLNEQKILEKSMQYMVEFLGARSASVRIYDPQTEQMLSYGSYPSKEETRPTFIPLEGSIAGEVVKSGRPVVVPNILKEGRYLDKEVAFKRGLHSLMAVPLEIPRFFPRERDTVGVIQIYYKRKDRVFTAIETQIANLMSRRLSYVIARKRILTLFRTNEKKDAIVQHIFRTVGSRGGVRVKEIFDRVMPELADIVYLQSCALFSVSQNLTDMILMAGYPEAGYHSIGQSFPVSSEPAFEIILGLKDYTGPSIYEVVAPSYLLVVDPQKSELISENLRSFAKHYNINSILFIPLFVDDEVRYLLTFDAIEQRKRYRQDEIDILLFLGRELMKAQKMERLDEALHDFKNPAIATAGFARRLKELVEKDSCESRDQILRYADILLEETNRLQELALSIYQVGSEQVVNFTDILRRRFEINKEAIKEQLKQNVELIEGPFDPRLFVRCYSLHLERIFDNLLNNATKAIPLRGGVLSIRTRAEGNWACAEISNTGRIADQDRDRILGGEGEGRGLYITQRIIRLLKGRIDLEGDEDMTTFVVRIPLYRDTENGEAGSQ